MQICTILVDIVKSAERFEKQAIDCNTGTLHHSGANILHGTKSYILLLMAFSLSGKSLLHFKFSIEKCLLFFLLF